MNKKSNRNTHMSVEHKKKKKLAHRQKAKGKNFTGTKKFKISRKELKKLVALRGNEEIKRTKVFYRSMSERRKALLRDANSSNSGLSQETRDFIKNNNGNKVPENYEVSHEVPLYTAKTDAGKKKLDVAKNMKIEAKESHRNRHKKCGSQYHKYPRK